jgi:DNA polymerase I-like protein with 3'-5' exonuclease and polymerase domains
MINFDTIVSFDFETKKIEDGAPLLPEPVGCALKYGREPSKYWAWGHPEGNNCTFEEFKAELVKIWDMEWLTHNGLTFDVPVAEHWFGLPKRDPLLTHDTLFMAYLHNPHARSLSLKDLADDWLGVAPDEQQEMYDWIMKNTDCSSRKMCGAYISETPVSMSGPYAEGDTDRTFLLAEHLQQVLTDMPDPYNRERLLAPILADIQNRGVRCDLARLKEDYAKAVEAKHKLEDLIRTHLGQDENFNPGSDKELGTVLLALGYKGFLTTPKGKVSMSRPSLEKVLGNDPELMSMLKSRSIYDTLIGTFMSSWIKYAEANNGRIHAQYNQVRNPDGFGTRTGRLSSSRPNFQNVPNNLGLDYFGNPFPSMRSYLLPEEGHVWVCGDFKNQEPRLTAHYESGDLMEAFQKDPELDPYIFVRDVCGLTKDKHGRHEAKQILLGLIYAMGAAAMGDRIGADAGRATLLRNMVRAALPDVMELDRDCKRRFQHGLPIQTLGGRLYYCEPPSNGRSWEYKALNTLIQGSAADQCKEALIYLHGYLDKLGARLLGTVHDEISVSAKPEHVESINKLMQLAANYLHCDVPMIMDVDSGANWEVAKP